MENNSNQPKLRPQKHEGILIIMALSRILTFENSFSKKTFTSDVLNYVNYLEEELGVTNNDRVMISADNSYSFILAIFALIHIDCSIVLVDSSLDEKELLEIAKHSNSNFCICERMICQNNGSIQMLALPLVNRARTTIEGNININAWGNRKDALILYTSGSTGDPKGVIKSGKSFLLNIRATINRMEYYPNDVLLPLIPFTHFYGLSIIFVWWITKCELVLCNYRNIRSIVKAIIDNDVTVVDAIPSTYYALNRLFAKRKVMLSKIKSSKVRMWCVGGSTLSHKLSKEFSTFMEMPLLDGYGLSETGNVALNTSGPEFGCGRPLDNVHLKIINSEGMVLPLGQVGEITVKSPGVMEKYNQLEDVTNTVLQDGWLKTNDLGYMDIWENLFVIGRKGDEILRKGYVIYPASIEKTLEDKLGIKSKVVSLKDERKGSFIILLVEGDNDNKQLRNRIKDSLNTITKPDKIYIIRSFPYLTNGKIDYKSIKNIAIQLNLKSMEEEICQIKLQ